MKIFFYVFANTSYIFNEVIKLSKGKNQNIEWGLIYPRAVYKDSATGLVNQSNIFYLYENFDEEYKKLCDNIYLNDDKWIDNIYSIIESSKFGYGKETRERQEKVFYCIYKTYKDFLLKVKPDYMVFPDIETVNGMLLLNICKELNIEVMVITHTRQIGVSFFSTDYRETLPPYFGKYSDLDYRRAHLFLTNNIKNAIIGNQLENQKIRIKPYANIFKRLLNAMRIYYKYEHNGIFDTGLYLRIRLNFEKYFELWREFWFYKYQIKYFDFYKTRKPNLDKFVLILLQVTPESSINTFSQYFIRQERMIELVRLNLPSNYKLLVKEHPAMRGMRKTSWYKSIKKKLGVFLVSHDLDTRELIKKSSLVVTVTGSAGLECYHMDKSVLMFGPTFFSHLVTRYDSMISLKSTIYNLINKSTYPQLDKKTENIAKIYNIGYDFFVHEPFHFERVMTKENINNLLNAIQDHIKRLEEYNKTDV